MKRKPSPANASPALEAHAELVEHPGYWIRRLHQISVSIFLSSAKEFGLTPVQYASLQAISRNPGINQSDLGKLIALDRQTISNVVQRLCAKNLLARREKNGRTSALFITGPSRAMLEAMQNRLSNVDEKIIGPLTKPEREAFMALIIKLVENNNELSRAPRLRKSDTVRVRANL